MKQLQPYDYCKNPTIEYINIVIERLKNQYEALCNMFHKFNFSNFTKSNNSEK